MKLKKSIVLSALLVFYTNISFADDIKSVNYSDTTNLFTDELPVDQVFKIKLTLPPLNKSLHKIVVRSYGFPFNDNRYKLLKIEKNKELKLEILKNGYVENNYFEQISESKKIIIKLSKEFDNYKNEKIEIKNYLINKSNSISQTLYLKDLLSDLGNETIKKKTLKEKLKLFLNNNDINKDLKDKIETLLSEIEKLLSLEEKSNLISSNSLENFLCGEDVACSTKELIIDNESNNKNDNNKISSFEITHPPIYFNRDYIFSINYYYLLDKDLLLDHFERIIQNISISIKDKENNDNLDLFKLILKNNDKNFSSDNKNKKLDLSSLINSNDQYPYTIIEYAKLLEYKNTLIAFFHTNNWNSVKIFLDSTDSNILTKDLLLKKSNMDVEKIFSDENELDFVFLYKKLKKLNESKELFIKNYLRWNIDINKKKDLFYEYVIENLENISKISNEVYILEFILSKELKKDIKLNGNSIDIKNILSENKIKIFSSEEFKNIIEYISPTGNDKKLASEKFDQIKKTEDFLNNYKNNFQKNFDSLSEKLLKTKVVENKEPSEIFKYTNKKKLKEIIGNISWNNFGNIYTSNVSLSSVSQVTSKDYTKLIASEVGFMYINGLNDFKYFGSVNFKINKVDFDDPFLVKGLLKDPVHKMGEFSLSLGVTSDFGSTDRYTSVIDTFGNNKGYFMGLGYRPYFLPMMRFQVGQVAYKDKILNPLLTNKNNIIFNPYISLGFTFDLFSQLQQTLNNLKQDKNTQN